jgi:hypothetical protein
LQSIAPSSRPVQLTPCGNRLQPYTALFLPPRALDRWFLRRFTRLTSSTPAERLGTRSGSRTPLVSGFAETSQPSAAVGLCITAGGVDRTDFTGSRVQESACSAAMMSWVPACCPDRGCGDAGGHNSEMSSLCRWRHDGDHDMTAEFAHRCDGSVLR